MIFILSDGVLFRPEYGQDERPVTFAVDHSQENPLIIEPGPHISTYLEDDGATLLPSLAHHSGRLRTCVLYG